MLKAIIFDMDGLLLDSERVYLNKAQEMIKKYNYPIDMELLLKTIGLNSKKIDELLSNTLGENFDIKLYRQRINKCLGESLYAEPIPLMKGVKELLNYLKQNHIPMVIATSTYRPLAVKALVNAGIDQYFDFLVCGDEVTNSKPDPEIYLKTIDKLGIKKEEAIIFEDSRNGLISANSAGVRCILIPDLVFIEDEKRKLAYRICEHINDAIEIIDKEIKCVNH